jgi:hypothetical protein
MAKVPIVREHKHLSPQPASRAAVSEPSVILLEVQAGRRFGRPSYTRGLNADTPSP